MTEFHSSTGTARPATIVISDWLANCRAGQWTPFEAATALKAALAKEGYSIIPAQEMPDPQELTADQVAYCRENADATRARWREHARQISQDFAPPDGWQTVPIEPTAEMIQACIWALDRWREKHGNVQGFVPPGEKYQVRWRAMLAAAPNAPALPSTESKAP